MLQAGDKTILVNIAKVITVLVVIMFALIIVAGYIGGAWPLLIGNLLIYNWDIIYRVMDKVALAITILVALICAAIAFLRVYFGQQPWSL